MCVTLGSVHWCMSALQWSQGFWQSKVNSVVRSPMWMRIVELCCTTSDSLKRSSSPAFSEFHELWVVQRRLCGTEHCVFRWNALFPCLFAEINHNHPIMLRVCAFSKKFTQFTPRLFSSKLPEFETLKMPLLSPTMTTGTIVK